MGKKQSYKFIGNIDKVFQTEEITTIFQELDVKAIQNARVGSQDIASVDLSDDKILDCCRYFQTVSNSSIVLLSNDKNLCVLKQWFMELERPLLKKRLDWRTY